MKKWISGVLTAFVLCLILPMRADAAVREVEVYLYRDYEDCVFFVSWQNSEQTAAVRILAPDGTEITATEQNTEFGRGQACVSVGTAYSGYWRVLAEGENLGTISVNGGSKSNVSAQDNGIRKFTADMAEDGNLHFEWEVTAEQDTVNLSIQASQGYYTGSRTVYQDYSAGRTGTAAVSPDNLQTGLYSFTIQVYDGRTQHTLTTKQPLYVRQPDAPEKLENVRVGSIDGEMFAAWDPNAYNNYLVTLYDESLDVIRTEYVYESFYAVSGEEGMDRIKVSVAAVDGNVWGEFDVFEIVRSAPSGVITFPEEQVTRESMVPVHIQCSSEETAGIYLDGTLLMEDGISGDYDLNLSEGTHEVVAYIRDINGNMSTFSKSITVDQTPPAVRLNGGEELRTASDSIVIEGSTEPNAVIMINGVEQELGSGSFMAKLALDNGINPISITAYDAAGNKSVKTITVERTGGMDRVWTRFILPGILFLLLAFWYGYLNRKPKEELSK